MYPPEKHPRNEKLKALMQELAERSGELLSEACDLKMQVLMLQMICIELMELLIEPEEPE